MGTSAAVSEVLDNLARAAQEALDNETTARLLASHNENVRTMTGVDPHWQDVRVCASRVH